MSTLLLRLELSLNQPWVVYAGTKFAVRAGLNPPLFSKSASNHWDTQIKSTRPHTHMHFKMSSSDKLKLPETRFLTPEEDQQLTDLAEDIAEKMLGPDWKERQEQRRAALSEESVQQ